MKSAIYSGFVTHTRIAPRRHSFRYRVFSLLIDLEELDTLHASLKLFARNKAAVVGFHDADHGDGETLREWVSNKLASAGIETDGPIRVLCYPRLWGYVFNPLTVWFCYRKDQSLAATIYEVHNTFGERHAYVLPALTNGKAVEQHCAKEMYVSPFLSMDCGYKFRIQPPNDSVLVAICESESGAPILNASFFGIRKPLTDKFLAVALLRNPLMTLKVIVAIHFEAFRLWLKRVPTHAHIASSAKS